MTEINHNASCVANGWDFQSNAAIVLFIYNIKDANEVKVEGEKEDIEITLNSGSKIMAQVKSIYVDEFTPNTDENKNVEKFKKALNTLYDSDDENVKELVYIINSRNPFNEKSSAFNLTGVANCLYNDLSEERKKKIQQILHNASKKNESLLNFNLNKLRIITIPFEGGRDIKYIEIQNAISRFLGSLAINERYDKEYQDKLQNLFWKNATIKKVTITKEDFIWPLIIIITNCYDDENYNFLNYDEGMIEEILLEYGAFMERKSNDFLFVNKVLMGYEKYISLYKDERHQIENFIQARWQDYKESISNIVYPDIIEGVTKLLLYNIIKKRLKIKKIKTEVNLK